VTVGERRLADFETLALQAVEHGGLACRLASGLLCLRFLRRLAGERAACRRLSVGPGGLDFRFDAQFRSDASSARTQGRFEDFIIETAEHVDDMTNMDL
jgi:hypothetical protein